MSAKAWAPQGTRKRKEGSPLGGKRQVPFSSEGRPFGGGMSLLLHWLAIGKNIILWGEKMKALPEKEEAAAQNICRERRKKKKTD